MVMMGEMSLDDWDEKSEKKKDQDEVDERGTEIIPKVKRCTTK